MMSIAYKKLNKQICTFQVIVVQFEGYAFFIVPLTIDQWMWCILFGIEELLYAQVITTSSAVGLYTCLTFTIGPFDVSTKTN